MQILMLITQLVFFFSNILNHIYLVCPNKICPEEYEVFIHRINSFMYFIIGNIIIISSIPKTNIEHYIMTKSEPRQFEKLIYTTLDSIKYLTLDLKPSLQIVEYKKGGNPKKSKRTICIFFWHFFTLQSPRCFTAAAHCNTQNSAA